MTTTGPLPATAAASARFHLHRAGVLNVWHYDEQVFQTEGGRLLLRGANGAGKSKTMEMLLPFVLDGDRSRMTASGRHHTSLLWLMNEGSSGGSTRVGYLWVEFRRRLPDGGYETVTCAVGLRHSASAKTTTPWMFTVPGPVPDLVGDDGVPLSLPRCRERVDELGGRLFEQARPYKEHVGRLLFGLDPQRYDDLLRLLYWLRRPQVGEDIEPATLAQILDVALPELDEDAVRAVGDSLDELAAHGEQLERLARAAAAVRRGADVYARYAQTELRARAGALVDADRERDRRRRQARDAARRYDTVVVAVRDAEAEEGTWRQRLDGEQSSVRALESGPLARNQQVLHEKSLRSRDLAATEATLHTAAAAAQDRADSSTARAEQDSRSLTATVTDLWRRARDASQALADQALDVQLPVPDDVTVGPAMVGQVRTLTGAAAEARRVVTAAEAAVTVVLEAAHHLALVQADLRRAEGQLAEAERLAEQAEGRVADQRSAVAAAAVTLADRLRSWRAEVPGLPDDLGGAVTRVLDEAGAALADLDLDALRNAPARLRAVVAPEVTRLLEVGATAGARRLAAVAEQDTRTREREQILAESDPAPPEPSLPRPGRAAVAGAPLWRVCGVRDGVPATQAALVEAALQASGLLDAHVRHDGSLLAADALDTVLPLGPRLDGPTLLDVMYPEGPDASPVPHEVVAGVLARIALVDVAVGPGPAVGTAGEDPAPDDTHVAAAVGRDGSWRLGPLTGRAAKPVVQYLGVEARAAERQRRLDAVDALLDRAHRDLVEATAQAERAATDREVLETWVRVVPTAGAVETELARLQDREADRDRTAETARRFETTAQAERQRVARAHDSLGRLASEHGVPEQVAALESRRTELSRLHDRVEGLDRDARRVVVEASRLEQEVERAEADVALAEQASHEAAAARQRAEAARQEHAELLDTLGAEVQELQRRLDVARDAVVRTTAELSGATARLGRLREELGATRGARDDAVRRVEEHRPTLESRAHDLRSLLTVPGLLAAAVGDEPQRQRPDLNLSDVDDLPGSTLEVVRSWALLDLPRSSDSNAVHAEMRDLLAGPAADHEPRVVPVGGALALLARDPTGTELPIGQVADRLVEVVQRERGLLTDRERTIFEQHLLGELGDGLRARRLEAQDLVRGMNDLLAGVRTSQGIRVRLDWDVRDDAGPDVRAVLELVGRPLGALLAEERARLRDALSALIEVQRAADPERGYADHLARALDYRRWSAFRIRLSRPEVTGWTTLTKRTALSQGEQKVVCYLPLFAAAAAHFTSIAGASPTAPRLVLLDDAFPKIDVRTHPLLFGLLVDLDLDFVVTSERLWGDHSTVPSLAVYEALRSPTERGIAQYRYVWDGQVLSTEGAS